MLLLVLPLPPLSLGHSSLLHQATPSSVSHLRLCFITREDDLDLTTSNHLGYIDTASREPQLPTTPSFLHPPPLRSVGRLGRVSLLRDPISLLFYRLYLLSIYSTSPSSWLAEWCYTSWWFWEMAVLEKQLLPFSYVCSTLLRL